MLHRRGFQRGQSLLKYYIVMSICINHKLQTCCTFQVSLIMYFPASRVCVAVLFTTNLLITYEELLPLTPSLCPCMTTHDLAHQRLNHQVT
jgi:hypothetical protein